MASELLITSVATGLVAAAWSLANPRPVMPQRTAYVIRSDRGHRESRNLAKPVSFLFRPTADFIDICVDADRGGHYIIVPYWLDAEDVAIFMTSAIAYLNGIAALGSPAVPPLVHFPLVNRSRAVETAEIMLAAVDEASLMQFVPVIHVPLAVDEADWGLIRQIRSATTRIGFVDSLGAMARGIDPAAFEGAGFAFVDGVITEGDAPLVDVMDAVDAAVSVDQVAVGLSPATAFSNKTQLVRRMLKAHALVKGGELRAV